MSEEELSEQKPLLIIGYEPARILWRLIFPYGLIIFWFGSVWISIYESDYTGIKYYFGVVFFGSMVVGSLILALEMLLCREIRFYKSYLEKDWQIFGSKKIEYDNVRLKGVSTFLFSSKNFLYLKKPSVFNWKCCGYDEYLLSRNNKDNTNKFLSEISGYSIDKFTKANIDMTLIKE